MIIYRCLVCDKEFKDDESANRKFCSPECYHKWRGEHQRGQNNPSWSGDRIKKICKECGKIFYISPCQKRYGRKYCSSKCAWKCRGKSERGKNSPGWKGGKTIRYCIICGKEIELYKRKNRGLFCSLKCVGKWNGEQMKGENNPAWQGGKSFEPYGMEFNKKLKKQIRKRDNFICQECGYTEKQLGRKLDVHHIDGNKKNNRFQNLISLCRSCHSQISFNQENWIEYFQNKIGG